MHLKTLIERLLTHKHPMNIGEAFPRIFQRTCPVLEPGTSILLAAPLLRFHQIDAIPIWFRPKQRNKLVLTGRSCLSRLHETPPDEYGKFLELPCERASLELSSIDIDDTLEGLLRLFVKTRFGFAWVESEERLGGFVSLNDLLWLYESGLIDTGMTAGDIASPIFSMATDSLLKDVLGEMLSRGLRRVFLYPEKRSVVTDRDIINYIFSTARLSSVPRNPEVLLDGRLGDLDGEKPMRVSSNNLVKEAALFLRGMSDGCLVCDRGVLTPWDLVMKPLLDGKLAVRKDPKF